MTLSDLVAVHIVKQHGVGVFLVSYQLVSELLYKQHDTLLLKGELQPKGRYGRLLLGNKRIKICRTELLLTDCWVCAAVSSSLCPSPSPLWPVWPFSRIWSRIWTWVPGRPFALWGQLCSPTASCLTGHCSYGKHQPKEERTCVFNSYNMTSVYAVHVDCYWISLWPASGWFAELLH